MRSRSSYSRSTALYLLLLSACTNGSDIPDDPPSLATTSTPATAPATTPTATTATTPATSTTPPTLAGATNATPETPIEFRELLATDWDLAAGTEQYICVRQILSATTYVGGWRGVAPVGTHHVVVTISEQPDGEPDGSSECDVTTVGTQNVFGAGVGGRDRRMPPGVAMKLGQGSQALLNLHLFNPTDKPLRGRSGALIQPIEQNAVRELADGLLAGPIKLDVPPGRSTSRGTCTFNRDATIFGIMPHMHQMGVAMQAIAHTAMYGDIVLYDGPYSFENQLTYPLDMLQFKAGDTVDVACTYENTSGKTLHWGGSSNDEMCNAGLGRFPAGGPSVCAK